MKRRDLIYHADNAVILIQDRGNVTKVEIRHVGGDNPKRKTIVVVDPSNVQIEMPDGQVYRTSRPDIVVEPVQPRTVVWPRRRSR